MQSTCHVFKRILGYMNTFRGKIHSRMAHCYVRCVPNEDRLKISFEYGYQLKQQKLFHFERRWDETFGGFSERIQKSVETKFLKKKKRATSGTTDDVPPLAVSLSLNGHDVENETVIKEAMVTGAVLKIDDCKLSIIVNSPTISKLTLPDSAMAGFPVIPTMDIEFTDLNDSEFTWCRVREESPGPSGPRYTEIAEVSRTCVYIASVDDIGWKLMLKCIPVMGGVRGREVTTVLKSEVHAGPGPCPFETRHLLTESVTESNCIRVVSYNILADLYADSDYTRDVLYPYCAPYALKIDYRRLLLLKELIGYNCDIMCLQEVDKKGFMSTLLPAMETIGYSGTQMIKGRVVAEGEAVFYRKSKFRFVDDHSIVLSEQLKENPLYGDIVQKVSVDTAALKLITGHGAVLQVVVLERTDEPKQKVCVANTHLYFHPDADGVRVLQAIVCVRHLEQVLDTYRQQGEDVSVIFCGDFNSRPARGVHQFMTQGSVPSDLSDWNPPGKPADARLVDMAFSHDLTLISGCGYPKYTNYVGNFNEMLDYIFIDSRKFRVDRVIPPPDHEEVTSHTALPSVLFPSDHIAQICDIAWKQSDQAVAT